MPSPLDGVPHPVWVWGLPLTPLTRSETLDLVARMINERRPRFFVTANLHYSMLTDRDPRLRAVNERAAFIVADGMPLVWASRFGAIPLPERVAGADLVPALCERAAAAGHRVFFLGGEAGIAEEAARRLTERFPGLQVAGTEAPPFRPLTAGENEVLIARVRAARPDLLFVAFGQPKGEFWLVRHHEALGVPVSVQIGASLDFVAGRARRAPRWLQRLGMEWLYRLWREPGRLVRRYAENLIFLGRMLARDFLTRRRPRPGPSAPDGRGNSGIRGT
jgi:N-acetylglucosaminyldiphosphoundecaprenol N-acetyl-beta-D-mannosaminyltransferase